MSKRGSLRLGGAAAGLALLTLLVFLTSAGPSSAGQRDGPRERLVKCSYSSDTQTLSVKLKAPDLRALRRALRRELGRVPRSLEKEFIELLFPSAAAIEVRIGEITVIDGESALYGERGGLIACKGGTPTVTNTDTVLVRAGKRVREAYLFLDFRYGLLTPGATDEGDGASEIELNVDLGGGVVLGRMTRQPDEVVFGYENGTTANLNAAEAVDDMDLRTGSQDSVFLQGAGSGDEMSVEDSPSLSGVTFIPGIDGGQGDDVLRGGAGPDSLFGGYGDDLIEAGAGSDFVFAFGGADVIDCGPGRDTAFVIGKRHRFRNCERKQGEDDFAKQKRRKAKAAPKVAGAKVVSPILRRKAKRFR